MKRRPDIQGLRALAVLLVIAYHADFPVPGGFTGVDVFFTISGFVITGTLLAELASSGRVSLPRFYVRRIKRLLPALAVMLMFVALVGTLADPAGAQHTAAMTGIFASGFGANAYLNHLGSGYFAVNSTLNPLLHTWTLAVEEQFYIVFPTLLAIGWWLGRTKLARHGSRALTSAIIAIVSVVSFLLSLGLSNYVTTNSTRGLRLAFYGAPTRAWEFGVGALVALAIPSLSRAPIWSARIAGAGGAVALAVVAFTHLAATNTPEIAALLPVGGTCLLLAAGMRASIGASRLLSLRPMVWIGDLSYSLYLWHWPLIVFAKALWPDHGWTGPIAAAAAFLPAWLSYRFVENPIRYSSRLGSHSRVAGRVAIALASVCIVIPVLANVGLMGAQKALSATAAMKSWQRSELLHADVLRGCDDPKPLGERRGNACTWAVTRPRGEIVLFGDSQAGQFTEPMARAGNQAGFDVTVVTYSSCPYIGLRVKTKDLGEILDCERFAKKTLETLIRRRTSLVVVAARTDFYIQNADVRVGAAGAHAYASNVKAEARLWRDTLRSTVLRLNRAGVPVVLVHPIPLLPLEPSECAVVRVLAGRCASEISRSAATGSLRPSISIEDAAVSAAPETWDLDFAATLCDTTTCSTARDGVIQYRNERHLSIDGSLKLTDAFYEAIVAHAHPRGRR